MSAAAAIVIDGVAVPEKLIAQEIGHHPAASLAEARTEAARALAIRALLVDRARRLGIEATPEIDADGREETLEEARIRVLLEQEVKAPEPSETELRRVYDSQLDRFTTPMMFEASHILLQPAGDEPQAWEATQAEARAVLSQLQAQPGLFGEVARRLSTCSSRDAGGALGQLFPGDLTPEVEKALMRLAPGEMAPEPVRSRFGWHILRLDRRQAGRPLPFEHVAEGIAAWLRERSWAAAATRYIATLAEEAREVGVALTLDEEGDVARGRLSFGDLLSDGEAVARRCETWLVSADPDLAALARAEAVRNGRSLAAEVRDILASHLLDADDNAWTRLISIAQGAEDPALACAQAILRQWLVKPERTFTLIRSR